MGRYDQSKAWLARAKNVLPCNGAQTLSKASDRNPQNYPTYIDRGEGSHVWCVDGHEYVDWMAALGPLLLGHAHPKVTEAVIEQAKKGPLFSLEHPLTVEVAVLLTEMIPGAEAVRFVKTGSAATSAAVRAARTYTGDYTILAASNSYHGCGSWFQVTQDRGRHGVPDDLSEHIRQFEYNNVESLRKRFDDVARCGRGVAAVIIEPARTFQATKEFLVGARKLCEENGAVLIFDEIVTAFRFPGHTYAAYSGVTPDLTCLGKAAANGYPLGAVVGKKDIMSAFDRCFISGTYHGEAVSLAAAKATLQILREERVVDHIWRQGATLMSGFRAAMDRYDIPAEAEGIPVCWRQTFKGERAEQLRLLFMQECALRGVLPGLICYPMYAHTDEDVRQTVQVYYEVGEVLERFMESSDPDWFFAEV